MSNLEPADVCDVSQGSAGFFCLSNKIQIRAQCFGLSEEGWDAGGGVIFKYSLAVSQ